MKDMRAPHNQDRVRQSFKRGLSSYHDNATHQAFAAQRLAELMQAQAPSSLPRVFEFGSGTGHLTKALLDGFQIGELFVNDLVDDCARFAPPSAAFLGGAVESLSLPQELDVICSASTVQWIEDLPTMLATFCRALKPGGFLALSGFGKAQFHELRSLGSTAAAPSYVDADAWHGLLPDTLKFRHLSQGRRVAWFDSGLSVLKHLRDTGVNAGASQRWSRETLTAFDTAYRQRFATPRGLPLTYDPVWLIAQKL